MTLLPRIRRLVAVAALAALVVVPTASGARFNVTALNGSFAGTDGWTASSSCAPLCTVTNMVDAGTGASGPGSATVVYTTLGGLLGGLASGTSTWTSPSFSAPFVSEGLASRETKRHIIVMAVPMHDVRGRPTGMLAGALLVHAFQVSRGSIDLGFSGLSVLDRRGHEVLDGFERPRNAALSQQLREGQVGLLPNVHGLDGEDDHLVAFATASIPG